MTRPSKALALAVAALAAATLFMVLPVGVDRSLIVWEPESADDGGSLRLTRTTPERNRPEEQHMLRTRPLIVATLLALAPLTVFAQSQPPIEQQMTPEQFKAAGLDKLDAAELGRLNDWLNRKIGDESAKAAKSTKELIETEHRGFFNFGGSSDPIVSRISGEFRGFGRGRRTCSTTARSGSSPTTPRWRASSSATRK